MATIKELLSAMIDKINGNEDKIDNIKGVPEAFDSITMTNGTDMANLTMSAEKELLFNGEAIAGVANWDELENKPFHSEVEEIEILPDTEATLINADMNVYGITAPVSGVYAGDTYIVTYNGVEYECVAQLLVEGGFSTTILGNLSNIPSPPPHSHNGEPFGVMIMPTQVEQAGGLTAQIISNDGASSVTIAIRHKKETITKISGKYVEGMGYSKPAGKVILVYNQSIEFSTLPDASYALANIACSEPIVTDNQYEIIIDGEAYVCKSGVIFGDAIIGNGGLDPNYGQKNTGEPFCCITNSEGAWTMAVETAGNHTISISRITETVHKIDQKFLPETSGVMVRIDITATENADGVVTYNSSKTYDEISNTILAGKIPYCVYGTYVLQLAYSDTIAEMSTFKAAASHKFSCLDVNGTSNSYMRNISIEDGSVDYTEHLITITASEN